MVRISDILKGIGERSESRKPQEEKVSIPLEEKPIRETPLPLPQEVVEDDIRISKAMTQESVFEEEQEMSIAKAMRETHINQEESLIIYNQGIELMRGVLQKTEAGEAIELEDINNLTGEIVERLMLEDKELLALTVTSTSDNYLIAHSINVAILAVEIGLGKGYNKSRLIEMGLCAFLHDLGMIKVMDIANQPRPLQEEEYAEIKKHPFLGEEIAAKIRNIDQSLLRVIKEHHERLNGKGYPNHLSSDEINEYSQIISLCDVYEAFTHIRPYRKALNNQDAIKEIISMNLELFDPKNIKILIKRLGLFPLGTWVELNTGEIGKVISSNEDFPLRPTVNIMFDINRQRYNEIKSINLIKQHSLYIKRAVDLKDLGLDFT